jgi:hypothetical protein
VASRVQTKALGAGSGAAPARRQVLRGEPAIDACRANFEACQSAGEACPTAPKAYSVGRYASWAEFEAL